MSYPKQPFTVLKQHRRQVRRGHGAELSQLLKDIEGLGGVVPLAAEGHGGHIGTVSLHHQPVKGRLRRHLRVLPGVLEGQRPAEAQTEAHIQALFGGLPAAGEAVHDAGHPALVGPEDVHRVPVGLPIVDDHGQAVLRRQGQLGVEEFPLDLPRRVLGPVVVEASPFFALALVLKPT